MRKLFIGFVYTIILCVLFSVELANCAGNIESSSVLGFYPGLLDVLYCDNDTSSGSIQEGESGIRQPGKNFVTSSTSAHKDCSSSESALVEQHEESTSSNSAHMDHSSSESGKQINDTVL